MTSKIKKTNKTKNEYIHNNKELFNIYFSPIICANNKNTFTIYAKTIDKLGSINIVEIVNEILEISII